MAEVRVIPASISRGSAKADPGLRKRRVAAYARVSTDSEEQLTSYEAQVDYYTKYIQERGDWTYVVVYTDEGISATNTKKRDGFQKMVADALAGKIDLIVTKSVSRFARNTVDSLSTVRKLKEKGVEVYFQKENIYTFDGKGELLITIMSSLAQEESRSISENVTWGMRKRMADGKVSLPYKQFLGYEKGEDGLPQIVEEEAKTVRRIFRQFMEGKTPSAIARLLEQGGILSPGGSKTWQVATVRSILSNEKYKGDALLQKQFTVDFLTKTQKINEGEVPQFYVRNSHPAIINPDEFDAVQTEIARRKQVGRPCTCKSVFSTKIVCGDCGGFYGPKVWNSNRPNRKVVWRCNEKYHGEIKCETPHVTEEEIKNGFLTAFNQLMANRDELLENCRLAREALGDCEELDRETDSLRQEQERVSQLARRAIHEQAHFTGELDGDGTVSADSLQRYNEITEKLAVLEAERKQRIEKRRVLGRFIRDIEAQKLVVDTFDEKLWTAVIDHVSVPRNGGMRFCFKDGSEVGT